MANTLHDCVIPDDQQGLRLDKWLATLEVIPSRSRAAYLIDRGLVRKDGKPMKASYRLQPGDRIQIEIPEPEPSELQPLNAPLDLLFEDEDLIVLNKPAGLVVHPAAGHAQDTLVNILLHHARGKLSMAFGENRPGIVHRLDRDTSGVLVVAKNDHAHHFLAAQFKNKTAHRIYWALTHGIPKKTPQTVRSYLARHPSDRKRFASSPTQQGKLAITHFKVLKTVTGMSWLECCLETGRTHQIRVHLTESGFPILGDPLYGRRDKYVNQLNRVALHACELGFEHPRSHEKMYFRVGWPKELAKLCDELGFTYVQA